MSSTVHGQISPTVGLYIMNRKGLAVLRAIIDAMGPSVITFIVYADDPATDDRSYQTIKRLCAEHDIPCKHRRENQHATQQFDGWCFAIGWRWLIERSEKLIVFHDSLLPRYRGFAPLVNMLVNGEPEIGVTALLASSDYDRGPIVGSRATAVSYPIKIQAAIEQIAPLYGDLALSIVRQLVANDELETKEQMEAEATYSLWLDEDDYIIDWHWPAETIKRFIDATGSPYAGAKTFVKGNELRVYSARCVGDVNIEHRERHLGKIIFMRDKQPIVVCGTGLLQLEQLSQPVTSFRTRFGN